MFAKSDGVLSGIGLFRRVFELLDADVDDWEAMWDGAPYSAGDEVARFTALTAATLTGERTALNILQRLSGTATLTHAFVDSVAGLNTAIVDTRKTTPLWRKHEKAAVRHGGGRNHRFALYDGILIKENHIAAAGSIAAAVQGAAEAGHHLIKVEVEIQRLEQIDEAVGAGVAAVLLDNMTLDDMREAVEQLHRHNIVVEASGNMSVDRVRSVAETGVDMISVGALTHSAPAADLSLLIEAQS